MSSLIVQISTIDKIEPHPNADRLACAIVRGWACVVGKDTYKEGDKCIYIPIDSVLPRDVEDKIFAESKVRPKNGRIRTIKLRGAVSQGLVVDPKLFGLEKLKVGTDVAEKLGIIKYEPPEAETPSVYGTQNAKVKKANNSAFKKYTDIENAKNYTDIFEDGEPVYISEKLHGTSFRCGWFPTEANAWWKKVLKFFGLLPKYEFCYGSRNIQLQNKFLYKGYYKGSVGNVYSKTVERYGLYKKLKHGEAIYGEIVGDGIQKGYNYGCQAGEHKLFAYDFMKDGKFVNFNEFAITCYLKDIPTVPNLYVGPYSKEKANEYVSGPSVICPEQKVREGVVVKPIVEAVHPRLGRKILKMISDEYLLEDNTDFH